MTTALQMMRRNNVNTFGMLATEDISDDEGDDSSRMGAYSPTDDGAVLRRMESPTSIPNGWEPPVSPLYLPDDEDEEMEPDQEWGITLRPPAPDHRRTDTCAAFHLATRFFVDGVDDDMMTCNVMQIIHALLMRYCALAKIEMPAHLDSFASIIGDYLNNSGDVVFDMNDDLVAERRASLFRRHVSTVGGRITIQLTKMCDLTLTSMERATDDSAPRNLSWTPACFDAEIKVSNINKAFLWQLRRTGVSL